MQSLKTLTSLNKMSSRPAFLGDNRICSFPSFLPLAIAASGGPEGYSSLAIIAFGAFEFSIPKFLLSSLGKNGQEESKLLTLRRFGLQGYLTMFLEHLT